MMNIFLIDEASKLLVEGKVCIGIWMQMSLCEKASQQMYFKLGIGTTVMKLYPHEENRLAFQDVHTA